MIGRQIFTRRDPQAIHIDGKDVFIAHQSMGSFRLIHLAEPVDDQDAATKATVAAKAITLTGDVTGSGSSSFAATIGDKKVTLAKMADMATASLLGRATTGDGVPEVLSASAARSLLNVANGATAVLIDTDASHIQSLGTQAAGSVGKAADSGHVHAHGALAGGSLHADVIAAGASGFMAGTDKSKLDGIASGATAVLIDSDASHIAPLGTQAAGSVGKAADSGHVHAHGALSDGSLHAAAIANSTAGFQTGADKGKQDNTRGYVIIEIPGAALSSSADPSKVIFRADAAMIITDISISPTAGATTNPAASPNDCVMKVVKNWSGTPVASKTFTAAITASTWTTLGTLDSSEKILASGDKLTWTITQNGSCSLGPSAGVVLCLAFLANAG